MEGIVLALGGGGVRGGAHTAVLDVLTEAQIPIVGLAGSSAGALAAALYAFGIQVRHNELSEWLKDPELERLQKTGALHQVTRLVDFVRRPYLAEGARIRQGYRALFGERRIEDSPIPLVIQACDFNTGELVMLRAGPVSEALAASSAVPSIFPPVPWHGRLLVDGDVAEKVPVTAAKALQAGPIVAVDVSNRVVPAEPKSALEAALQAGEASRRRLLSMALAQADVVISLAADPPIETFDYTKADLAYQLGRQRAEEALPRIRQLLARPTPASKAWWSRFAQPKPQAAKTNPVAGQAKGQKQHHP
ncbi:MAG: patatin-like phospholipase family protein [Meiothermus sp.]|uniref:patatin-like phospholipase family protein n=1 Tax=Meiothermus sp. TaxID=1955249 RepID=UPI0025EB3D96|nr:patatin-like phospholipase family protein [Meiothermus sp.]MCS7068557.1 patatin-like phospholipase family protein [Meiothermus sp.]MCX7601321.1 patatin-like phospholipase family protein [Meiothermus sp.]MDW8425813.1 patatin-like phospholipase family protein [Meiothermus sp.]